MSHSGGPADTSMARGGRLMAPIWRTRVERGAATVSAELTNQALWDATVRSACGGPSRAKNRA